MIRSISKTLDYVLLKEHRQIIVILIPPLCGGRRIHDNDTP